MLLAVLLYLQKSNSTMQEAIRFNVDSLITRYE